METEENERVVRDEIEVSEGLNSVETRTSQADWGAPQNLVVYQDRLKL